MFFWSHISSNSTKRQGKKGWSFSRNALKRLKGRYTDGMGCLILIIIPGVMNFFYRKTKERK